MSPAVSHVARRPARLTASDDPDATAVDQRVWAPLVPPDHSRRQVTRRIDVAPWRDLLTDGDRSARGRTAEDPGRVMKCTLRPFHDPRADREVMAAAQVHAPQRLFKHSPFVIGGRRRPGGLLGHPLRGVQREASTRQKRSISSSVL